MGLNPALILGGIVAMGMVAVFGVIEMPGKTTEIFGFCGMITGTLLLMLKQDQDHRKLQQQIIANNRTAVATAAEVKEVVQQKGTEVKASLKAQDEKLNVVLQQTNSNLEYKLNEIPENTAAKILDALPDAIKSVIPSPGKSP